MAASRPQVEVAAPTAPGVVLGSPRWLQTTLRFARRKPLGASGAAVILLMALVALLADVLAPHNPLANNFLAMFKPPGGAYWLGTDAFGRDVLSRLLFGARTALIGPDAATTYAELAALTNRSGNVLRELGVRAEERVLLALASATLATCAPTPPSARRSPTASTTSPRTPAGSTSASPPILPSSPSPRSAPGGSSSAGSATRTRRR